MHASLAFVNGAGIADSEELRLLNTLLTAPNGEDKGGSQQTHQGGKGDPRQTQDPPERFNNDPPDPKNPNEERERHLDKINR